MISATAVATCRPTINARYGDSGELTFRSACHEPPMTAGISTLCPRLDTGNSSVIPCTAPITPASSQLMWCIDPPVRASLHETIGIMSEPGGGTRTVVWGTAESAPVSPRTRGLCLHDARPARERALAPSQQIDRLFTADAMLAARNWSERLVCAQPSRRHIAGRPRGWRLSATRLRRAGRG